MKDPPEKKKMNDKDEEKLLFPDHVEERKGKIPPWLLITYVALLAWAAYYMVKYWGGLGPGLGR